jgi:hypothetical protein
VIADLGEWIAPARINERAFVAKRSTG